MAPAASRVALTGGIATGKSHCLRRIAARGIDVIDADALAHAALAPGTAGFRSAVRRFGSGILADDGSINRPALGRIVFADARARLDLEAIVHPVVYAAIADWFRAAPEESTTWPFRVADIPLLYETDGDHLVDRAIVVACGEATQLTRLLARGLSAEEARLRIAAQMPIAEKRRRANFVIETEGSTAETDAQVDAICERLRAELA